MTSFTPPALAMTAFLASLALAGEVAADSVPDATPCDTLEPGAARAVDCALTAGDVVLNFVFEGDPFSADLTLVQTRADGAVLDSSEAIPVEGVVIAPALRDINSDAVPELFIPVVSGNVNTEFLVWQADHEGVYHPIGSLSGFGVDAFEVDGTLIRTMTRETAATFRETVYNLDAGGFTNLYTLSIDYAEETCRHVEETGIAEAGLDMTAILETCQNRDWE